jgi:hypothetical protein
MAADRSLHARRRQLAPARAPVSYEIIGGVLPESSTTNKSGRKNPAGIPKPRKKIWLADGGDHVASLEETAASEAVRP